MVLQQLGVFKIATQLDLNMGCNTTKLSLEESKICTIILPWGKYSYEILPLDMGISGSVDISQEKTLDLMRQLDFVRMYLDELLVLSKGTYSDRIKS